MSLTAEVLVKKLTEKGYRISLAESCTGGLCTAKIVDVPDASKVLDASIVTYADEAKVKYLGVKPETIKEHGVVSEPVAMGMAIGVAKNNNAQVGVGISGIAGPTGGTPEKPVGTVCFGFFVNGKTLSLTEHFGDVGRNAVRELSCIKVFTVLEELLEQW